MENEGGEYTGSDGHDDWVRHDGGKEDAEDSDDGSLEYLMRGLDKRHHGPLATMADLRLFGEHMLTKSKYYTKDQGPSAKVLPALLFTAEPQGAGQILVCVW